MTTRVLLVEDDEDDYVILRDLLHDGRRPYDLAWVSSLKDARERLAGSRFDIIFADFRLGGESGLELLADAAQWRCPLVLLTGLDDHELDERAAEAGAADYLPKRGLDTSTIERTIRYVLAREEMVRSAQASEERFRAVIEQAAEAIVVVGGPDGESILHWNTAAEHLFGYSRSEAFDIGFSRSIGVSEHFRPVGSRAELRGGTRSGATVLLDISIANWTYGVASQSCYIIRDITKQRAMQQALEERATTDELTGLANRTTFVEHIAAQLGPTSSRSVCVLYLDLDKFKSINDHLGHAAGDALLIEAAERITGALRPCDLAARLGGDEFAIALHRVDTISVALDVADRCLNALSAPYMLGKRSCHIGASIGVALRGDTETADDLIQNADLAMYQAKRDGRNRVAVYDAGLRAESRAELDITEALRSAAFAKHFELHYQPIFDLGTFEVTGVECLLRYRHPELGLVSPQPVIHVAEQSGLIVALGNWILRRSIEQAATWLRDGLATRGFSMSINVSALQLGDDLVTTVRNALADCDLPPAMLQIEVTESALIDAGGLSVLRRVADLGITIAIDDFGTGYSSLSSLIHAPATVAKIDRSIIAGARDRDRGLSLVRGLIQLCHQIGLTTVAEGIEVPADAADLQEAGCDLGQGFLLARPTPADGAARVLALRRRDPSAWTAAAL